MMKFLALLLVVATVHARSSLHHYGWAPETETVFKYQSQILSGIPEINNAQKSGLTFNCKVRVQSFQDYTLRVKVQEPQFMALNGKVHLNQDGRIMGESGSQSGHQEHLPEEFRRFLEQPFLAHMKKGVVEEFFVAKEEPVSVTNIKRAILAQIQLDVSATQRSQIESNHIQLPISAEGSNNEELSYFTVEEESLQGNCKTDYTIHRLPEYKAKEMEEKWATEEKILKQGVHAGLQSRPITSMPESELQLESLKGKAACEGKTYYQITKTKDFDHCKVTPVWQSWVGVESTCDQTTSSCSKHMTHLSSSTYIVCGSLSSFHIRKVMTEDSVVASPLGYNTDEVLKTTTLVNTELVNVERMSTPFNIPTETKKETSLVYQYPTSQQPSEQAIKQSQEILGVVPVLPLPSLTEAPQSIIPIKREKSTIISEIVKSMKKIAREVSESPESCSSKNDVAGSITVTSQFLRSLSLSELKQVEQTIRQEHSINNQDVHRNPLTKLFYDTLAIVGTNPSTMLIVEKVNESEMPLHYRTKLIQVALRSVRYPTEELLGELVKLVKSSEVQRHPQLFTATVTGISTLIYKAWIEPSTMLNNYPTKLFGVFGTKDSSVLKEDFIPFLGQMLESTQNEQTRLVIVTSLGKIGHIKALQYLVKVAEGKMSEEPLMRSLAVYSMKRVAKRNPSEVRPILLALINNPVEVPEVRIAAVAVLPWTRPTSSDLQKLAVRTWTETSKEVASFITSTLKSLTQTEVPELKSVGSRCKTIISMLKPENEGLEFSQGLHYAQFVDYLKTAVSQKLSYVIPKNGIVPSKIAMKNELYVSSSYKSKGLSFAAYTKGMDTVLYKYLEILSPYILSASPKVKESLDKIFEELKVQSNTLQTPKLFLQEQFMGLEHSSLIDSRLVLEAIEQVTQQVRNGQLSHNFSTIYALQLIDGSVIGMTDAGFPMYTEVSAPIVVSAKGSFEASISESEGLNGRNMLKVKIVPVFNGKIQMNSGVISPFTAQLHGTGVEASVHSSIPIEAELRLTRGELDITIKSSTETEQANRETETFHMFVHPYTIQRSFHFIKKETKTTIKSAAPMKHFETMIGENLGLNTRLIAETDAKFNDVYSYIEKINQISPISFFSVGILPSSVRMSSTKVKYSPALSSTKEFHIKVKLSTRTPEGRPFCKFTSELNEESLSSKGFKSCQETLQQLRNGYSSVLEINTALKSQYGAQKNIFSSAIVIGKPQSQQQSGSQSQQSENKVHASVNYKLGESTQSFGIIFEGTGKMDKPQTRWNKEQILRQPLELQSTGKIRYGLENSEKKQIIATAKLYKSEEQKQAISSSPEWQRCQAEESQGMKLSPICMKVRNEAASLDKFEIKVEVPKKIASCPLVQLAKDMLKAKYMIQTTVEQSSQVPSENQNQITLELNGRVSHTSELAQLQVKSSASEYTYNVKNIHLCPQLKNVFPLSIHNPVQNVLLKKISSNTLPSSCAIEQEYVRTFDNKTYKYDLNDCTHLLLADRSRQLPVAVLTTKVSEGKEVTILSGHYTIRVNPQSSSKKITINEQQVEVSQGQVYIKKNTEGQVVVEIKYFQDNVMLVSTPQQGLVVLTDGQKIEVVAPGLVHGRSLGLCGDNNNEITCDLKTPRKCIMKSSLSAISFMLNKSGSSSSSFGKQCQGIPAQKRAEFERESQQCTKEMIVPTPLIPIYERIQSLNKPSVSVHVVNKQQNQVCISKQKVKVCSGQSVSSSSVSSRPELLKPKNLQFVCVSRPSTMSQSLVLRAQAGENLSMELSQLPVVYSKVEFEPMTCRQSSQSGQQSQYQQQPQY